LSLAQGQLTYAAADGEANHLTVDVVRVAGVDYIRFREAAGVVIKATGKGLAADSGQVVRAPTAGVKLLEIETGDKDDSVNLTLANGLPGKISVDAGTAVKGNAVTVSGTAADDAIGLTPRRTADGLKAIVLTGGARTVTLASVGSLTLDLSQAGKDSLTVDPRSPATGTRSACAWSAVGPVPIP